MKRPSMLAFALAFAIVGCGGDRAQRRATQALFTAQLVPSNEVPQIANAEASGYGSIAITLNITRDHSGAAREGTVDFDGTFDAFPPGTAVTLAQIHTGVAGATGSPVVTVPLTAGEVTLTNGSGTLAKRGVSVALDVASEILSRPSAFYFDVHTTLNPAGAARGQLVRTR